MVGEIDIPRFIEFIPAVLVKPVEADLRTIEFIFVGGRIQAE